MMKGNKRNFMCSMNKRKGISTDTPVLFNAIIWLQMLIMNHEYFVVGIGKALVLISSLQVRNKYVYNVHN